MEASTDKEATVSCAKSFSPRAPLGEAAECRAKRALKETVQAGYTRGGASTDECKAFNRREWIMDQQDRQNIQIGIGISAQGSPELFREVLVQRHQDLDGNGIQAPQATLRYSRPSRT